MPQPMGIYTGYKLVQQGAVGGYRGVDRNAFSIELVDEMLIPTPKGSTTAWEMYGPGWRRDAYRLFEEHIFTIEEPWDQLDIITDYKTAKQIAEIIEPHLGKHEILACSVWPLTPFSRCNLIANVFQNETPGLGYDIAYINGFCYSAIRGGFGPPQNSRVIPIPELIAEFGHLQNEHGLFTTTDPITPYMQRFFELVPAEDTFAHMFAVYWLSLMPE